MKIAIISGYSSGLGADLARIISMDVDEMWAISRREISSLGKLRPIVCDITRSLAPIEQRLEAEKPEIMWLVCSAGVGYAGDMSEMSADKSEETVALNAQALTAMIHLCDRYLAKGAHIVNLASAAAFCPQPHFAVYAASKAYVLSLSRALAVEMKPRGITVTAVCPGAVDTPFIKRAYEGDTEGKKKRGKLYHPLRVAYHAYKCAKRGKQVAVYGFRMKLCRLACKILPTSVTMKYFG